MNEYTVEVYGKPLTSDDDWSQWRHATDVVPGTILLEDETEPCLIFPIEARALNDAAIYVQGVMSMLGLPILWGRAYAVEPVTVNEPAPVVVPDFVPAWLEDEVKTSTARALV